LHSTLYENARELHAYTRQQKREGSDFYGEMNNFQEPMLSSLWKVPLETGKIVLFLSLI
jgi:hypothetical protein